jgi:hypothetical protein
MASSTFYTDSKMKSVHLSMFASLCVVLCAPLSAAKSIEVETKPIWNQVDAENKCASVCEKISLREQWAWTGEWRDISLHEHSLCECIELTSGTSAHNFKEQPLENTITKSRNLNRRQKIN